MKKKLRGRGEAGFTLVELIVVMAVFVVVIMVAGDSFKSILTHSSLMTKRAETNIEGIVGLEMLRHDLAQIGYGLPTSFMGAAAPTYQEAANSPESAFNDAGQTDPVPRAIVAGDSLDGATTGMLDGSDYLALKGTSLARNGASQRWTYVSEGEDPRVWPTGDNLDDGAKVIVLRRTVVNGKFLAQLVVSGTDFSTEIKSNKLPDPFKPTVPGDTYYVYGISPDKTPRMPFNRIDYFIERPDTMPASCAPNTGILYKATLNHGNDDDGNNTSAGNLFKIPVLDCVADMQVVLGWDLDEDGVIDTYSNADGTTVSSGIGAAAVPTGNAESIREQLKLVKVYLLAQDGRRDPNFTQSSPILVGDEAEKTLTREFNLAKINANGWQNYRWKVYRIAVNPTNLRIYQK